MKFLEHPSTHGHHVNHYTCGSGLHRNCAGFSGEYDTYLCGCCCHDREVDLSDRQRAIILRLRGGAS